MKTQEQIVARINEIQGSDFFGWQTGDLLEWLDFEPRDPLTLAGLFRLYIQQHGPTVASPETLEHVSKKLVAWFGDKNAKQFIKPEATAESCQADVISQRKKSPAACIADYMPFAWDRANGCRGISARRSIEHMKAWLWLDGKEALADKLDSEYRYYGKPCLVLVCNEYGLDWKQWDDNQWTNAGDGPCVTTEEALA